MRLRDCIEVLTLAVLAACAPRAAVVSSEREGSKATATQDLNPGVVLDGGWPAWTVTSDIPAWPCDVKRSAWKRRILEVHVSAGDCTLSMAPPDERGWCPAELHESEQLIGDVGSPAIDRVFFIMPDQDPLYCGRRWHCGCDEWLSGQEEATEGHPPPG
ncbi:hypothetical protein [Corallococcus exercitus]|uniref:Uncharacterized protein n=1 Tax=Corallococcus exercitus TaxID=2316736 RepID=A0A7Y4JSK6_9BACT|nr:hypothetical protein [Corallococcus exercitus]NOK10401.1 hypothetical protein [Corallococcus exercitus]